MASGLGACGKGAKRKGVVTVWHHWTSREYKSHTAMLERFKIEYPHIKIEETLVRAESMRRRWIAALKSGLLPDIVILNSSWLRTPAAERLLYNLAGLAKRDELRLSERLATRDYERCLYNEGLYALPLSSAAGGTMLYYNKSVLAKAGMDPLFRPKNWEAFTQASELIVERLNKSDELTHVAWDPYSYSGNQTIVALALGVGAPLISRDGLQSLLGEPNVVPVFEAIDDHINRVYHRYGAYRGLLRWRQAVGNLTISSPMSPILCGTQAFAMSGVWLAGNFIASNPPVDFDVAPVPGLEQAHGGIAAHGWAYGMSANPNDLEAAWALLKYMTIDVAGNGRMAVDAMRPSPIRSVNDSDSYGRLGGVWNSMRNSMAMDMPYPYSVDSDFLRTLLVEYPFRKLRGDSTKDILQSYHKRLQANLDALAKEGLR